MDSAAAVPIPSHTYARPDLRPGLGTFALTTDQSTLVGPSFASALVGYFIEATGGFQNDRDRVRGGLRASDANVPRKTPMACTTQPMVEQ